jgi:hypothetical protein
LALFLAAQPAAAQIAPPVPRLEVPPGAVVNDPYRVFGDDAPNFSPLAFIGALGLGGSVGLTTEYSDNVARQRDGEPLPSRFRSKSDWIFRPNASVSAEHGVGRQNLFGSVSVGRTIYARNTQLNSNRFAVQGGGAFTLGQRCGLNARIGIAKRDTQLGAFEEVVASTQTSTTYGASASCRTVSGITASVGYNRGKVVNDSSDPAVDRSFANVRSQSVSGSLGYAVGVRGQVGLQGGWSENSYPNQILQNGEVNRNEVKTVGIFGAYRIGTSLRATAGVGSSEVSSSTPGSQGFKGANWNLGVSYAGPRLGGSIATGRSVNGASGGSSNYSIRNFVTLGVTYRLNDKMRASTGYSHDKSDFRGISQIPETEVSQQNTNDFIYAGFDYSLNKLLSFSLDLNHQRRSSQPSDFSYKVNTATFGVRARF